MSDISATEALNKVKSVQRGTYLFVDLDNRFLYVGKSDSEKRTLHKRLQEHFERLNSSVVADGTIDPFEVSKVYVWQADEEENLDNREKQLISDI